MNNANMTVVYFDNGKYSEANKVQWTRNGRIMTVVMKLSIDDVTYIRLVENISRKMKIDEATTKLQMSYIPLIVDCDEPMYIVDDDDVMGYLTSFKDQCRSLLHVELVHMDENQAVEQNELNEDNGDHAMLKWEDRENVICVENEELLSSGRGNNYGMGSYEGGENDFHSTTMANEEKYVVCDANEIVTNIEERDDIEVATEVQDCVGGEWDDGMAFTIGEEFGTKQEVQDIVEKAAHTNCFEFAIMKSDTQRYVLKCCQWRNGCKWVLRASKLKNTSCFTIRKYYKMHSCSRVSTSTSGNRRKGTPRLVASILHEDYPGQVDTPTPKHLIDMVQKRLGVKVSYSTALRAKKLAANVMTIKKNSQ